MPRLKSLQYKSTPLRALGALLSFVDPRTYIQILKLLHFANYSHATQVGKLNRGTNVRIAPNVSFANAEHIRIGSNASIAEYATVWAAQDGAPVEIGEWAAIGPHSLVTAAKYDFSDPREQKQAKGSGIFIGDRAVIYSCCIILAGSKIGEGAVIGPGSLVNGEIPPHAIAMGSPARVVLQRKPED